MGSPGRDAVKAIVPILKAKHRLDFVIVNAENVAGGAGVTPKTAEDLLETADCLTSGQHIWRYREIGPYMDQEPRLLKPANYPPGTPGFGSHVYETKKGVKVGVINLLGRVFMGVDALDDPFRVGDKLIAFEELRQRYGVPRERIAYVADGREDVPILKLVGFPIAVADAHESALQAARHVTRARGGDHAMEEVIDLILEAHGWSS